MFPASSGRVVDAAASARHVTRSVVDWPAWVAGAPRGRGRRWGGSLPRVKREQRRRRRRAREAAALVLQPGGSPSAAAAEREAASPPAGEPLRKRPRRDGPGPERSPNELGGAAPEPARRWRRRWAGGAAPATAAAGEGDNGPGLQGLSREPPPADDFYDEDDDDDEGDEEEEAAAAIGYRGAQGAGSRNCASPPPSPGDLPGAPWRSPHHGPPLSYAAPGLQFLLQEPRSL
ncbi:hypothetical protein P7K49_024015 [Saguinus oedipus]|uniref:Uncharacterized protein n=1 Tax=Saguinus oedipus TaxID=9490 RepID=A0ABQ9UND1_SAGOE|nr:hypothetical protein P7K49_024015 [Saguinus oedipus]